MAEINKEQIFEAINLAASQNFLSKDEIKKVIEEVVKKAFHTKYDPDAELELAIDEENQVFSLINNTKYVVDDNEYEEEYRSIEIPLSQAIKMKKDVKVGDQISEEVDFSAYSRHLAQQIRQMFTQTVREKKKEAVFAKHKSLKGEMIEATVSSITNNYVILLLDDGTTAFMPSKLRNPRIKLSINQRTKVFVEDVLKESRDSQIIVSNGSKEVIKRVLELEVPEIAEGIIEIVDISRLPGIRSKVAVKSNRENIDPVGSIIGAGGQRMRAIVGKLEGEKLDIVNWSNDKKQYIANSLSPARIVSVLPKKNEEGEILEGKYIVIAPNAHATIAIGKAGSNAQLAVELSNSRIDVLSVDQAKEKGIDIEFNVGISPSDLESIEQGNRISRNNNSNNFNSNNFNTEQFDDSIESFNNSLNEDNVQKEEDDEIGFDIDDSLFTDEQLKQMEEEFGIDEELANYGIDEESEE